MKKNHNILSLSMKVENVNLCILLNSLIYFLLAWFFVFFSVNLFSILLAKSVGFQSRLYYFGFTTSGQAWTDDNKVVVFFFGNLINLALAVIFERLYKSRRKYPTRSKIFYLWVFMITFTWFFGNIITGAFFNFGIGVAMRGINIPSFLQVLLAIVAVALLVLIGFKTQRHVAISANAYFTKISGARISYYLKWQIFLPAALGIFVIFLFKIPHQAEYYFLDFVVICTMGFLFAGLFIRIRQVQSIRFMRKSNSNKVSLVPLFILLLIMAVSRLVLASGVSI